MVKGVLQFLHKEVSGLHEAAYLLASFAFLAQLLALVRDRLLAHFFGAGTTLDIYYAAFRIPDLIFVSVASIVSIFVLIPFLAERVGYDRKDAKRFLNTITSAFALFILFFSIAVFFAVPILSNVLYPGFTDPAAKETLILLTRILLLSPILLGLSNILASVTQVFKKFFVYALSPILYNFGIIVGIIFLYPLFGVAGLAYGVVLGALLHLIVQLPTVARHGLLPRFTLRINFEAVKYVIVTSLPRTITLSVNQVAILALVALASLMPEGSISIFNFSLNLQGAPLTIIGVSYSVAAFPTLARLFSNGERKRFLSQMIVAVRHILFWSFPAIVLFIVLRAQIVRTVLGSGAFSWDDTRLTAAALALFVISLAAHSLMLLFVRGYYAAGKTRKPLIINTLSSALIILFAYIGVALFMRFDILRYFLEALLRVENVEGTVVLMLPIAYSVGLIINTMAFWFLFRRDFGGHLPAFLYTTMWQSFSASVISGAITYLFLNIFDNVFDVQTLLGIFLQGLCSGVIGIAAAIVILKALKNKEVKEIWESLHHKFWERKPILAELEEL